MIPLYMSAERQPSHLLSLSLLETCYKHRPKLDSSPCMQTFCMTYLKPPAKGSRSSRLSLFRRWNREVSLPSLALPAHELSRQPRSELSLKEFLLLVGSRPECLHSAAGEAPYCLDKLPNTQPGGCPITHPLRCVCALTALYILRLT